MPFIPRKTLHLQSQLSVADALHALKVQVAEPRPVLSFGWSFSSLPFEGTVNEASFEIQRVIQYRNSFLPQIRGAIEPTASGCSVSVTMTLHPLVLGFGAFWLTGVSGAALMVAATMVRSGASVATFIPVGMLLFFWAMASGGFGFEARKAERLLREIFVAPSAPKAAGEGPTPPVDR